MGPVLEGDCLVWRLDPPGSVVSTASVGGGFGTRRWIVNAQVEPNFEHTDLDAYVARIARLHRLEGPGVGMLTAASVAGWRAATDGGVTASATTGVRQPTWAADPDAVTTHAPGTINVVVEVPVALGPAAHVNAVVTATEAKTQALIEGGVAGTGTASDAVSIVCPAVGSPEPFAGPRSTWGARIARAVHQAVAAGLA